MMLTFIRNIEVDLGVHCAEPLQRLDYEILCGIDKVFG